MPAVRSLTGTPHSLSRRQSLRILNTPPPGADSLALGRPAQPVPGGQTLNLSIRPSYAVSMSSHGSEFV
jgi:hypothetical protein